MKLKKLDIVADEVGHGIVIKYTIDELVVFWLNSVAEYETEEGFVLYNLHDDIDCIEVQNIHKLEL